MSYTKAAKKNELIKAILEFKGSNRYVHDFMLLFAAVHSILHKGNGLSWSEIQTCLKTAGIQAAPAYDFEMKLGIPKKKQLTNEEITQLRDIIDKFRQQHTVGSASHKSMG